MIFGGRNLIERAKGLVRCNAAGLTKEWTSDMATQKATIEFLLAKLRPPNRFSARAMFGEYALYADDKVVALVCDDLLYVKIVPASHALEPLCEQGKPYPGAKLHYIVEEGQLSTVPALSGILFAIAESRPEKRKRATPKRRAGENRR